MSVTWAVLSDGRYLKILYKQSERASLRVLKTDNYAGLCYQIVNNKPRGDTAVAARSKPQDYIRLQADFLSREHQAGAFDDLLLVAPDDVIERLCARLPATVTDSIVAGMNQDWLPKSNDDIAAALGDRLNP